MTRGFRGYPGPLAQNAPAGLAFSHFAKSSQIIKLAFWQHGCIINRVKQLICAILALLSALAPAAAPQNGNRCAECERDANGRIHRSTAARNAFRRANPCPATHHITGPCPGYVIDHIVPLKRGGPDEPNNMQWQTIADAKAKDKVE